MDFKLIIAVAATIICLISYVPYLRDIFKNKTKPHLYTWLIWMLTQGTAAVALLYGGGKFGGLLLIVGTVLVVFIFLLSFKYGTKNITKSDTVSLVVALLAIVVWWQMHNPLIAVFMITAIDLIGYFPTFRKSYREPWTETILFWNMMVIVTILSLVANSEYNLLTVTYLAMQATANAVVSIICLTRRRVTPKPSNFESEVTSLTASDI